MLGDNLYTSFEHVHFLPVDFFILPIYGSDPSEMNTIVNEENIFCYLPSEYASII